MEFDEKFAELVGSLIIKDSIKPKPGEVLEKL